MYNPLNTYVLLNQILILKNIAKVSTSREQCGTQYKNGGISLCIEFVFLHNDLLTVL